MAVEVEPIDVHAGKIGRSIKNFINYLPQQSGATLKGAYEFFGVTFTAVVAETLSDPELRLKLEKAAQLVLQTKFKTADGIIIPWTGKFTLLLTDKQGDAIVGTQNQEPQVDKFPFAIQKALAFSHLEIVLRHGGLTTVRNMDYLQGLGLGQPGRDFFMGTAKQLIAIGDKLFYLSAAGCDVDKVYLAKLLGLKDEEGNLMMPGHDTQAGLFDNVFCELAAKYLKEDITEPMTIDEPEEVKNLLYAN